MAGSCSTPETSSAIFQWRYWQADVRFVFTMLIAAWAAAALYSQSPPAAAPQSAAPGSRPVPGSRLPVPVFDGLLHDHPAIAYDATEPDDPVSRVNRRIGPEASWAFEPSVGYLKGTLAALELPVESQVLIFSKTALQQRHTSPATPRAFYFNDAVVAGFIPGAPVIEIASLDARQGAVFYRLVQDPKEPPHFERRSECLTCHISNNTMDVPGFIARSMFAGPDGHVYPQLGSALVDHRAPYEERWGGWFVTGAPPALAHLGNQMVGEPPVRPKPLGIPLASLAGQPGARRVLSPYSDVTALLVFDHQMRAANLLTRLGWEARVAGASEADAFGTGLLADLVNEVADYLLFVDEPPLPAPITGGSGFAEVFAARGPFDTHGRSLREFDRTTRLFKYPASYMVYTPVFDALPPAAREALLRRMQAVLGGEVTDPKYARLPVAERAIAREMLESLFRGP